MKTIEMKRRIEDAKALDFGTIFNQSIELFKKVWVQGLVVLLLNMVLSHDGSCIYNYDYSYEYNRSWS